MMYTKIEISEILKNATSEAEVLEVCSRFKYLIKESNDELIKFIGRLSCKKILQLNINQQK